MTARRWPISSTTFPRDELFQISEDELFASGARHPAPGRAARRCACSCASTASTASSRRSSMSRATATTRRRAKSIHAILARAFNGRMSASTPTIDEFRAGARALHRRPQRGPAPACRYSRAGSRDPRRDPDLGRRLCRCARAHAMARPRAGAPGSSARAQFSPGYRGYFHAGRSRAGPRRAGSGWRAMRAASRSRRAPIASRTTRTTRCGSSSMCWARCCRSRCRCRSSRISA